MIVVSDTSPVNYLILIGAVGVLPVLFNVVYVPEQVAAELRSTKAPKEVQGWMSGTPVWFLVRKPKTVEANPLLDAGELEAIALAQELKADHILMDEWAGRGVATSCGLHVVGTLGVLDQAAQRGLLELEEAFEKLKKTTFRVDPKLLDALLLRNAQRKQENE